MSHNLPAVTEALARLDAEVAAGSVDLVEYWRRRAAIEAGQVPESSPGPDGYAAPEAATAVSRDRVVPSESGGGPELIPGAPGFAVEESEPSVPGPVLTSAPQPSGDRPPTLDRPAADTPFAPEEGAVVLDRRPSAGPVRRRWWQRLR